MDNFIRFGVIGLAVVLISCGPINRAQMSNMDNPSLTKAMGEKSDEHICWAIDGKWGDERYEKFALLEAEKRTLGDCTEEHIKCVSFGYSYKTPKYSECRMELEKAKLGVGVGGGSGSHPKNCFSTDLGGGMVTTNCY